MSTVDEQLHRLAEALARLEQVVVQREQRYAELLDGIEERQRTLDLEDGGDEAGKGEVTARVDRAIARLETVLRG